MHKLTRSETQKLFFKSKSIFKTAFFNVKIHYISNNESRLKNIIVVPKKCGIAVRRNYLRRITKYLVIKYNIIPASGSLLFIYTKENLDHITYDLIKQKFIKLKELLIPQNN